MKSELEAAALRVQAALPYVTIVGDCEKRTITFECPSQEAFELMSEAISAVILADRDVVYPRPVLVK